MSDIGQQMLGELKRIRESLAGAQPLGFGKKDQPVYVFVKLVQDGGQPYVWYTRDKTDAQNVPIFERDLTGYLDNLWLYTRSDATTGESIPKLNLFIRADRNYLIQTGFTTNFAKSLLAGLLELEASALSQPLTLVVDDNLGTGRGRPTLFCRVETGGKRMTPHFDRNTSHETLYAQVVAKFGFRDPYAPESAGVSDGEHDGA